MPSKREIAEDQAAEWAMLLAEDPDNPELQQRFEDWLKDSSLNATVWVGMQRVQMELDARQPVTQELWPSQTDKHSKNKPPRPLFRLTVAGGLAASLLAVFLFARSLHLEADFKTSTADHKIIELEDGSSVHLAPESAIEVTFEATSRQVHLLKGDAYFEVSPDADKPFSVAAGDTLVKVVGTAFNVDQRDGGVVVSVSHGHVVVEDTRDQFGESRDLIGGEEITLTEDKGAVLGNKAPEEVASWRDGKLIAQDWRIGDVVDALRSYHNGIILVSDVFASRRVTGIYKLDTPVITLQEIAASHGVTFREITPWMIYIGE